MTVKQSLFLITFGVIIGLMVGGLIWLIASPPRGKPVTLVTRQTDQIITVYISGEIANPGVYQLPPGSRVKDAIEIAGGLLSSADLNQINQAAMLVDSSHITILSLIPGVNSQNTSININTATEDELEFLPGIGPVSAKSIIEYRMKNGSFGSIEEIQKVEGIGPAIFEKIKDLIYVGD